jgi:hypothetical protein
MADVLLDALNFVRNYDKIKEQFSIDKETQASEQEFEQYFCSEFRRLLYDIGMSNIEEGYATRSSGDGGHYELIRFSFKHLKGIEAQLAKIEDEDLKNALLSLVHEFPNALKAYSNYLTINPNLIDRALKEVFNNTAVNSSAVVVAINENNDPLESTIDHYFAEFIEKEVISQNDYDRLKDLLYRYLKNRDSSPLPEKIPTIHNNKKRLGFVLGEIHRAIGKTKFEYAFFELIKNNITQFEDEDFTEENYTQSNLMKYLTTKPTKNINLNAKYGRTAHFSSASNSYKED